MTNAELLKLFNETYPEVAVSDYRPLSLEFIKDKEGITIWTENGDIIQWFPDKMAIEALSCSEEPNRSDTIYRQAAIDAFEPKHRRDWYTPEIIETLESLPSAQPDLLEDGTLMMTVPHGMLGDVKRALVDEVGTKNCKVMYQDEPERKKGEWTKDCACGICGFKPWYERDIHTLSFCPNCGARMDGDPDE